MLITPERETQKPERRTSLKALFILQKFVLKYIKHGVMGREVKQALLQDLPSSADWLFPLPTQWTGAGRCGASGRCAAPSVST